MERRASKRLTIRRETLRVLTSDELRQAAGGDRPDISGPERTCFSCYSRCYTICNCTVTCHPNAATGC
jgi:hypothetical protein